MRNHDYAFSLIQEMKLVYFKTTLGYQCNWGGWIIGILRESQSLILSNLYHLLFCLAFYQRLRQGFRLMYTKSFSFCDYSLEIWP